MQHLVGDNETAPNFKFNETEKGNRQIHHFRVVAELPGLWLAARLPVWF